MIRNAIGLMIVIIGAYVFSVGFRLLSDDMRKRFVEKFNLYTI